jgi:hypothetical protein
MVQEEYLMNNNYNEMPSYYAMRWEGDVQTRYSMLWDTLLDTDDGISEEVYNRLVELGQLIDPNFVNSVSKYVDATDGRFYIKGIK